MRNLSDRLLFQDSHDTLTRVLQSWRLWLVGALLGALVAAGVYALVPPDYRATAVVVVDQNLEEAWPVEPGQQFYFLGRETRKLEILAWSDETLQMVAEQVGDVTVEELRAGILTLSQPADGGWRFVAESESPERAEQIAAAWAEVFSQQVLDGIELSAELEQMRREVITRLLENPGMTTNDTKKMVELLFPEIAHAKGVSPFVTLSLAQTDNLTAERTVPASVSILVGSVIGACGLALFTLIFVKGSEEDENLVE